MRLLIIILNNKKVRWIVIGRKPNENKYIEHDDYYEMIIDSPKFGYFNVLIDREDYEIIKEHKWFISKCWNKKSNLTPKFYPATSIYDGGRGKERKCHNELMHRFLMKPPKGKVVDHIIPVTDNECDNRKANLRVCTQSQNRQNYKGKNPNNTSGYIGVAWNKREEKWMAHIRVNWKFKNLGYYDDILDAVDARKA